eukprot:77374-Prorocentrum_minimum.AAC.3
MICIDSYRHRFSNKSLSPLVPKAEQRLRVREAPGIGHEAGLAQLGDGGVHQPVHALHRLAELVIRVSTHTCKAGVCQTNKQTNNDQSAARESNN